MFQDNQGCIVRDPQASPEAQILVDRPRKEVGALSLTDKNGVITISTARIQIEMDKRTSLFKITDKIRQKVVVESARPVDFMEKQVCLSLKAHDNEYFYGGGVQNGRFSHNGKSIRIVNTNQWTDGGVASPTPFYWSTEGYGVMWYTFRPGLYDFGATNKEVVKLSHEENYLDVFFMVNDSPLAGQEGKFVTSRHLRDRLFSELNSDVSLRVEETDNMDSFKVSGRGELHLSVLIENMRREGYEFAVSKAEVLYHADENGKKLEPMELAYVDVPDEYTGAVIDKLSQRKGEMINMKPLTGGYT